MNNPIVFAISVVVASIILLSVWTLLMKLTKPKKVILEIEDLANDVKLIREFTLSQLLICCKFSTDLNLTSKQMMHLNSKLVNNFVGTELYGELEEDFKLNIYKQEDGEIYTTIDMKKLYYNNL